MGRQRGDVETSEVWALWGSFFLESQTVLRSVWVEVWVEIQNDFRKRSRTVPVSPI